MKADNSVRPLMKGGLGESFNTLGYTGTAPKVNQQPETFLIGRGIDLGNLTANERRAKRKLLTKTMAMLLLEIAMAEENWKWHARFESTLHCQDEQIMAYNRAHTDFYCKQRCCLICLANRKAQIVNTYLPIVEDMPDPHFVTLTVVSVTKEGLKMRVDDIVKAIRTLIARYKKRNQRGKQIKFYGIWALESNFNPVEFTYNPHIHLILPSEYAAQTFQNDWLEYWRERNVKIDEDAQKYRRVKRDQKKDLIEIVKYGSKIFTEPDIAKRMKYGGPKKLCFIYVRALYNILLAMDGHDVFNTFGFKTPKLEKPCKQTKKVTEYVEFDYDLSAPDWVNENLGIRLTNYKVPEELEALLQSRVDTKLE